MSRKKLVLAAVSLLAATFAILLALANVPLLRAQSSDTDWEKAAGGKMSFDVASIKLNTERGNPWAVRSNVDLSGSASFVPTGGLFSATDHPLLGYLIFAYKLTGDQAADVGSRLPKWAIENRYDIEARASDNPTKDEFRLMMQSLLADRFKLSAHFASRNMPVFALVLAQTEKLGPKLQRYESDPPCPVIGSASLALGGVLAPKGQAAVDLPDTCGAMAGMRASRPGFMKFGARNITMSRVASDLRNTPDCGSLDRPLQNRTGLTGTFDFTIEFWLPLPNTPEAREPNQGPTCVEALREQLGLKVEPSTGTVDFLVIDHIEEPSPN
jgi:uncharacterized protein (TIGR03435 family)